MTIPAGAAATMRCTATSTRPRRSRKQRLFLCSSLFLVNFPCKTSHYFTAAAAAAGRPRSSGRSSLATTALKMHRHYARQPPHDASLYDLLGVAPNCTLREVQAAYRKRSREFHPDKARVRAAKRNRGKRSDEGCQDDDDAEQQLELEEEEECKNRLARLREAYDVLKDDSTRLPYHRFGLVDTDTAAELLTGGGGGMYGGQQQPSRHSPEQDKLLRLMGYEPRHNHHRHHHHHYHRNQYDRHQRRVAYLAASIVELIRPVVEGTISQQDLVQHILTECNEVKSAPLVSSFAAMHYMRLSLICRKV